MSEVRQEWKRKHIYNPYNPKGGVTLLYKAIDLGDNTFEIYYKYSVCSHKDTYNRKKGVLVATDKPVVECEILAERYSDVISAILHDIVSSPHGDGIKQPVKDVMAGYLRHRAQNEYNRATNMLDFYFS